MKNIAMRFTAISMIFSSFFLFSGFVQAKVLVGYFSIESQENFEKNIKPFFEEFKGSCKSCEIVNLTPYDEKGLVAESELLEKVKNPPKEMSFYFFDWNKKLTDQNRPLATVLSEKIKTGKLVLAAVGVAAPGETGSALSRTVMGQTMDAIIIGEITGRERMLPQSFFGPEMLTALSVPKEHAGKGLSPLYFAAHWAAVWGRRAPEEWLAHFRTKKMKSRKIFLEMRDLL